MALLAGTPLPGRKCLALYVNREEPNETQRKPKGYPDPKNLTLYKWRGTQRKQKVTDPENLTTPKTGVGSISRGPACRDRLHRDLVPGSLC